MTRVENAERKTAVVGNLRFVGRGGEIEEFRKAIFKIVEQDDIFQTIWERYGSVGIGKTSLQLMLVEEAERLGVGGVRVDFAEGDKDVFGVMSKMSEVLTENQEETTKQWLEVEDEKVGQEWESYLNELSEEEKETMTNRFGDSVAGQRMVLMAQTLINSIEDETKYRPLALMFDSTDEADQDEVVPLMEEFLVSPLVENGRVLMLWFGRRPQRWKRFEVRRKVFTKELGGLEPKELEEQAGDLSEEQAQLFMGMQEITQGNLGANQVLIEMLKKGEFERVGLIEGLKTGFVDKVFDELGIEDEVRTALSLVSLVRGFDVVMLGQILKNDLLFENFGRNEFGGLLSRLRSSQLVNWDEEAKGYVVTSGFREILSEWVKQKDPEKYRQAQKMIVEVYEDWIGRAGSEATKMDYKIEKIYHLNLLGDIGQSSRLLIEYMDDNPLDNELGSVENEDFKRRLEHFKLVFEREGRLLELGKMIFNGKSRLVKD